MDERSRQFRTGLVLLVAVWIGGYWLWQPRAERQPGISFDQSPPRDQPDSDSTRVVPSPLQPDSSDRQPEPTVPAEVPLHIVGPNETLSDIAKAHYGRASLWEWIYHNNRAVITDPDRLELGMQLRLVPLGEDGG